VVEKIEKLNMTKSEIKSIRVLEFNGKTSDWEGWSEKFKARAKRKGYKDLLLGKKNIPTDNEYQQALTVSPETSSSKETIDLAELNEEAYEDIILSIDHGTKQGKVAFSLIKNCKTSDYPEGNCKLAWDRLVAKYAPKTAPSLLKLKKQFANSLLKNEVYPDEWITELESLRNDMDSISLSSKMNDQDFMIHILNNLPESYDVILDGMESRFMLPDSDPSKLTIENIRDKLNNRFERITKNELAKEEEHALNMHWQLSTSNTRVDAAIVVNMDIKVEIARTKEKEIQLSTDLAIIAERKDTQKLTVKSNAKQMHFTKTKQHVQ
jgi:hypothetical protein